MVRAIRAAAVPRPALRWVVPAATLFSFGWLLAEDAIQPLALYVLELYLSL
jgi:hypothetical protein